MTTIMNSWAELMQAPLNLIQTSGRAVQVLSAFRTVIASLMGSMAGATRNP